MSSASKMLFARNNLTNEKFDHRRPTKDFRGQYVLRKFFGRPSVEIFIGLLVIGSVILTLFELWLDSNLRIGLTPVVSGYGPLGEADLFRIEAINFCITCIFVLELTLRFVASSSKSAFFAEFWLDILATLPVFRIFRSIRALRLLRLIRLIRLLGVMSRLSSHFPTVFRRGAIDFLTICGLIFTAVIFGTAGMTVTEGVTETHSTLVDSSVEQHAFTMENSFWFSVYTIFSGEPIPHQPKTFWGKIVTVFLMFMGLTIFAIFAGTVSAFMVDRLRMEGRTVRMNDLQDHIVICGWTPKTEVILREYRASKSTKNLPIVIITEIDVDKISPEIELLPNVFLVQDDFTKIGALQRAGIEHARICIVLADTTGGRSEQDADARTILASLTVEKSNPEVYTCAELFNRSYGTHLELGQVNEFVISEEYGAYVIAQAGMHRGLISVLGELLTYRHGNEFFRAAIPDSWVGQSFNEMLARLKTEKNAILVAVQPAGSSVEVNPNNYVFTAGDEVVVICRGQLNLT